jgi:hypothetical protein
MAHYHKQWAFVPLTPFNFHFQHFNAFIDYQKDLIRFESKDFILLQTSYYQQDRPNHGSGAFIVRNGQVEKLFPIILNRYDAIGWSDISRFPFPALRVPRNSVPTRPDLLSTLPPPTVEDGGEQKKK